ncbi:hypothetical protein AVEN_132570-1 [Araneus ventricosus]|uniref:Reverse transcriptase domain-containing protein n=1 Tax=Araneus ventricosus TaxID=182803 RepID=A0A4Y2KUC4_ARAVE|nr:hypothetical protein AVEN_132570-1 [Araneus ventricosus]
MRKPRALKTSLLKQNNCSRLSVLGGKELAILRGTKKFAVRANNELSHTKTIKAGVAQGSKVGRVLFALYINDIPKQFNTILNIFADDTAILARNKNHNCIQIALNRHEVVMCRSLRNESADPIPQKERPDPIPTKRNDSADS